MTRFTRVQAAHTYGVLDPHVVERRDTKFVDGSLSDGRNIVIMPQGGYTDRGGTDDYGRVRKQLTLEALTAGMISMPNGGSASGLLANLTQTTAAATGSRFVLAEITFSEFKTICFADIQNVAISTTGADAALICEYWNGVAWQLFAPPLLLTTSPRSRRFALAMTGVVTQKIRFCVDAATAAGTVSFTGIQLFQETALPSMAKLSSYHYKASDVHQLVVTDRNVDVFEDGIWKAAIPLPASEILVPELKFEFAYDTILVFHQDLQPQKITRLGSAAEWSCEPIAFENVPLVDYGGSYTNGNNEVQELTLYNLTPGSENFELIVEGKSTYSIPVPDPTTGLDVLIKNALEALPNVSPGLTVTGTYPTYRVEFSGEGNENRDWLQMSGVGLDLDGVVRVRTITEGRAPGEPVMSVARGWPSVGRLAQKRLVLAGFKSKPNSVLASVSGSPFDLNTEQAVATAAFLYDIGENEANVIRDIYQAKTLIFLGSAQHAWLRNSTLSAEDLPEFSFSDAPGIDKKIPPVSTNSAIFYVQDGGTTLQMFAYTEIEQNYVGDNASVLSAHLIKNPVDMTRRRSTGAIDSDLLVMVNADGTATVLTLMRTQDVSGFAPWATDGQIKSAEVDRSNSLWFLVNRLAGGLTEMRLEKVQPLQPLDEAETRIVAVPTTSLSGLERFNARVIWAVTDDEAFGPVIVADGTATFPEPISGSVRLGTWSAPFARDPEIYLEQETGRRQARLKRVNRIQLSVIDTASIAISANDGAAENLPLVNNNEIILGQGPLARPFTGTVEAEGMHGFTEHGQTSVTQTFPGRMTVRRVSKDIVA